MSLRLVAARCHRCQRNRPPARLAPTAMATRCDQAQSGMASPGVAASSAAASALTGTVPISACDPGRWKPLVPDSIGRLVIGSAMAVSVPSARAPGPPRHPMVLPRYSTAWAGFALISRSADPIEKLASRASAPFVTRTRYSPGRLPGAARPPLARSAAGRRCSSAVSRSAEAAVSPGGQITPVRRRAPRGVRSVRRYPLQGFPSSARQRSVPAV